MSTTTNQLSADLIDGPIVVAVGEADTAPFASALDVALRLGNELVVVSAYQPLPRSEVRLARREAPADVAWQLGPDAAIVALHEDLREQAVTAGVSIECVAHEGAPAKVIVDVATAKHAGLIIMGNTGTHGRRRLCGCVTEEVSRRAPCSVLIVDTAHALAA